jgi:photosystem II stability/assembly factor-like uncharacterized protein
MKLKIILFLCFHFSLGFAQNPYWRNTNGPTNHSIFTIVGGASDNILSRDDESLLRSTNSGISWERIEMFTTSNIVYKENMAFLGNRNEIFKSTDFGLTWNSVFSFTPVTGAEKFFSSLCVTIEGDILAGIFGGGILRSANNGDNWVPSDSGMVNNSITTMLADEEN